MNVTYLIPARDKRSKIELPLKSAFAQTYPCRIIISDQGSTDGTWPFIVDYVRQQNTRHEVWLMQCPHTPPRGMSAFNIHINWLMDKIREGIVLISSADDVAHPEKTSEVVRCFEEHDPAMVLTAQQFQDPDGDCSITAFQEPEQMLTGKKVLDHLIGGSSTLAWSAEFFHKVGGAHGIVGIDCFLPFLAAQDKGCYWTPKVLHSYINHADAGNMGLGGVLRAAVLANDVKRQKQIAELIQYQMCTMSVQLAGKAQELYPDMSMEDRSTMYSEVMSRAYGWTNARNVLTDEGIEPLRMTP